MLDEAQEQAELALTELRHVVRGIHPPILTDRGLAGAVRALAAGRGGATFPTSGSESGSGLLGMRRRIAALDGTFALTSPDGGPTVIEAELPCVW